MLEKIDIQHAEYSGFWRRCGALVIDWIAFPIVLVLSLLLVSQTNSLLLGILLITLSPWLYFAVMASSPKQGSLGKIASGIIITDINGQRIGLARATLRLIVQFFLSGILLIGYIIFFFSERNQTLHDSISGCVVVNKGKSYFWPVFIVLIILAGALFFLAATSEKNMSRIPFYNFSSKSNATRDKYVFPSERAIPSDKTSNLQPKEVKKDISNEQRFVENIAEEMRTKEEVKQSADSPQRTSSFTGKNFESLPWRGSVMFDDQDMQKLYDALRQYGAPTSPVVAGGTGTGADSSGGNQGGAKMVAPSFFLNSVIFYEPENWAVWLNNSKIRKGEERNDLKIGRLSEKFVEVLWQSLELDAISPNWALNMESLGNPNPVVVKESTEEERLRKIQAFRNNNFNWDYISRDGNILVDSANKVVRFKIGLNQSFVSESMELVEGQHSSAPTPPAGTETAPTDGAPVATEENVEYIDEEEANRLADEAEREDPEAIKQKYKEQMKNMSPDEINNMLKKSMTSPEMMNKLKSAQGKKLSKEEAEELMKEFGRGMEESLNNKSGR